MLPLLQSIEAITSCRDRDRLPYLLIRAVASLLGPQADVGVFTREPQGEAVLRVFCGPTIMQSAENLWPDLVAKVRSDGKLLSQHEQGRHCGVYMLRMTELSQGHMMLAFNVSDGAEADPSELVVTLAKIYGDQIKLLDYSELDTLTRLLNRKTFDETFDKLLASEDDEPDDGGFTDRRSGSGSEAPAWLCVVDIDHFKRINDNFGHLFGDEVLLRMGDLMRKVFRAGDRLFRFGGEEFVVILNAETEELASAAFNRLRTTVEAYEFPQVGKVTCSIGFTKVSGMDVPTDVIGRADEALYFAKENGRNQVHCYDRLVAEGAIVKAGAAPAQSADDDFDIDALFG